MLANTSKFYKNYIIDSNTSVNNVYDVFANTQKCYSEKLRTSLKVGITRGGLATCRSPVYYNYLLVDSTILNNVLGRYSASSTRIVENDDFGTFCEGCFYVGKGTKNRKFEHLVEAKEKFYNFSPKDHCKKLETMCDLFRNGGAVTVIQLFPNLNHYEAHAREYAMIHALGLHNTCNIVHGTTYGDIKFWTTIEVINFGKMLLYNALLMCIIEPPHSFYLKDIVLPRSKVRHENWELRGILDYFLEI